MKMIIQIELSYSILILITFWLPFEFKLFINNLFHLVEFKKKIHL